MGTQQGKVVVGGILEEVGLAGISDPPHLGPQQLQLSFREDVQQ